MLGQLSLTEFRRPGRGPHASCRLGVIARDPSLAERAARGLEREGLMVTLEINGPDLSVVHDAEISPTVVVVVADSGEHRLEEALQWAGRRFPHAVVIVVLPTSQYVDAGSVLSMGAHGLLHERDLEGLLGPVFRLAAGGHVSVPSTARNAIHPPALSHRERQTLGLALAGLTNAQIARKVYIAESTVKAHLSSAFRRLGVHSRREAAALLSSDPTLRSSVLATLRLSREFPARRDSR
jgi:DNA-binding NarL/FixJ family response regulator